MAASPRGLQMIKIVSILVSLATIAVILRIVARLKRRHGFGTDDYLIFTGLILMFGMLIELSLWCTIGGNGTKMVDVTGEQLTLFFKIFLSNQFTYFVMCPVIKMSIVCFYRRIFVPRLFQHITLGINCLIGLWGAAIFLACALQCFPLKAYWHPEMQKNGDGRCFDGTKFFITNQVFNIVMDFVILALPLPMIWNLQRVWQDKLALTAVFALGGFVCFASIYRVVALFYIGADLTYTVYTATLWTHVEPSIGIVCACCPIIRGLFPGWTYAARSKRSNARNNAANANSHGTPQTIGGGADSRRNSQYLKMVGAANTAYCRGEDSDEDRLMGRSAIIASERENGGRMELENVGGILVRTSIDVTKHEQEQA